MDAHPDGRPDISRIAISNHAKLRAQMRLGVAEAAEHIRDLLSRAEKVDPEYVKNAPAYEAGGVTIVLSPDGEIVQTIFRKGVEQR